MHTSASGFLLKGEVNDPVKQSEIYDIIHEKYDKLLWSIAAKISGDYAIADVEDNYQDLWMTVFDAIEGFKNQNDKANGPVESWVGTKDFGKYLKTCLWNKKNHKGKNLAARYHINRDTIPTHSMSGPSSFGSSNRQRVLQIPAPVGIDYVEVSNDFAAFLGSLSTAESKVIACILDIPDKCITVKGKVKVSPIQNYLGWTRERTQRALDSVNKKMSRDLNKSI